MRTSCGFDCDGFVSVYPKYECPFPLSDKYFLFARMTMRAGQVPGASDAQFGDEMGIYLIDGFGNELLLHAEQPGCYDPLPLCPQPRPPVIPPRRDFENREGYLYVADVYRGTHMAGVPRGSVKSLRVVESPEKRHWSPGAWFGQGWAAAEDRLWQLENPPPSSREPALQAP